MKLGVVYPQIELASDPLALHRFTHAAEEIGYHHLVMYDHVIGVSHERREPPIRGRYGERSPFHDPLVAFAYLAALTERIEFVSGVLVLPQRQTVLVARQTADIDLLSGGRLRLGVGAGYSHVEYHAMGMDFAARGAKLTAQIPYLRRLWSEELISFEGEFDQIDRANIVPRPTRRIPIWCGGFAEAAFRRAVALADGFIFGYGLGEDAAAGWLRVRELLAKADRPVEDFGAQFILHPPERPYTDQEVTDGLLRLRDAGATHASLFTMGRGFRGVDQHIGYIAGIMAKAQAALR